MTQGATVARAFTSDAAGNIIQDSRSGTAYGYTINDAGRIAQLKIGTTVTAKHTYDFQSRLSVRQTLAMSPAGTTWSLYDTWDHLLAETDNAGHILREYMWIGDEPVAVIDWTITSGTPVLHFVHTDHLHRPELMTDTSDAVIWKASYETLRHGGVDHGLVDREPALPGPVVPARSGAGV